MDNQQVMYLCEFMTHLCGKTNQHDFIKLRLIRIGYRTPETICQATFEVEDLVRPIKKFLGHIKLSLVLASHVPCRS